MTFADLLAACGATYTDSSMEFEELNYEVLIIPDVFNDLTPLEVTFNATARRVEITTTLFDK